MSAVTVCVRWTPVWMVKFVGLMNCIAKSSRGVALQGMCLSWEENLQKDFLRDPSTERGLLYPAANPIIKSQAGELYLNGSHAEAAARCCLAVPAGPYTGIVQLLKWDHGWKPCPMVSLNTSICSGSVLGGTGKFREPHCALTSVIANAE